MKKSLHFNTGQESSGGAAEAVTATGFDASILAEALAEIPEAPVGAAAEGGKPAEEVPADSTETPAAETPAADAPKTDEKKDDKVAATDESADADDKLAVPELVDEAKEDTWIDVAARLGVTPPTDPADFETVEKNIQEKYKSEYERGKVEGKAEATAVDLANYTPNDIKALPIVNALRAGVPLNDILLPLQGFNAALALSPVDRLTEYYTGVLKMTPDAAADQIAVLEQNGSLATEDAKVRTSLETARDNTYNKIIGEGDQLFKDKQAAEKVKAEAENKSIKEAIRSRKEFMGAEVTDEHHIALEKNWDTGTYKKLMAEDPQAVADFIYWKTFGKQRTEQLINKTVKDTKLGVIKKQANTPTQVAGSKAQASKEVVDSGAGNFDAATLREGIDEMSRSK